MPQTLESGKIFGLMQPLGGLVGKTTHFRAYSDEPRIITRIAQLGNIGQIWRHAVHKVGSRQFPAMVSGSGSGLDDTTGLLPALAEGLERYCASVFKTEQFITATAEELGREALDLDTIPRCSSTEFSHPKCPLRAPDKKVPIRWVRGLSLLDGRPIYLPVVMVYLYAGFTSPGERIALPITTGCAAHITLERALVSAILEVIERDAISITWLQRLALPRIEMDCVPPLLAPYWECCQRASKDLEYIFLDATSDLGIPTVYGLQISRTNKNLTTLVSCSTAMDSVEAVVKVIKDMAACRIAFRTPKSAPENWDDFTDVFHGAAYMVSSERAEAFEFLLQPGDRRRLSEMTIMESQDDKLMLSTVLEQLRLSRLDAYAVDLSTDEALRAGIRVVRAIIPGLQPLSFYYRARYLGHPRLYEAPRNMGHTVYGEEHLNRWPQPFA